MKSSVGSIEPTPVGVKGIYYGWYIVAICVLTQIAANSLAMNTFSLFVGPWSSEMHAPISTLLLALTSLGAGYALLAPFTGTLSDNFSARSLFCAGLLLLVLSLLGISSAHKAWQIIALYAVPLPLAMSLTTDLVCNTLLSRWFVHRLGLALGISSFGLGAGGIILPPIVAALLPEFGWRTIVHGGVAIIALIIVPINFWLIRDRPTERDNPRYRIAIGGSLSNGGVNHANVSWREILSRRHFWLLIAIYIPMLALYSTCIQNVAPIALSRGMTVQTAGFLMSALSLSQLFALLVSGILCDRLGARIPLLGLALSCAIGGVIVAFGKSVSVMIVGVMLAAFGGSIWPVLTAALAVEFGASKIGRALGLASFFLPLGVLAPFCVAKIQEATGSYVPGLLGMVTLVLLSCIACVFLRQTSRSPSPLGETAVAQ